MFHGVISFLFQGISSCSLIVYCFFRMATFSFYYIDTWECIFFFMDFCVFPQLACMYTYIDMLSICIMTYFLFTYLKVWDLIIWIRLFNFFELYKIYSWDGWCKLLENLFKYLKTKHKILCFYSQSLKLVFNFFFDKIFKYKMV